jgi:predicted nucleic acid-binding Zn ribbon protein
MAETKVLTNPDLLTIILSFTGVEIKKECNICGSIIKYQILNQEIEYNHKSYIAFESCKKKNFCNDECLYIYKKNINNEICFLMTTLTCIVLIAVIYLIFFLEGKESLPININLFV